MAKARNRSGSVDTGSGNVFVDLGFPDAGVRTTKVALAVEINRALAANGLTQTVAAKRLGINQPKISALMNYRLEGFSVERLMNILTALGRDVEITIRARRSARTPGRIVIAGG